MNTEDKERAEKFFEEEEKKREALQDALAEAIEKGRSAPDFAEEAKKKAGILDNVAAPETNL